jgi:hypothetical protein
LCALRPHLWQPVAASLWAAWHTLCAPPPPPPSAIWHSCVRAHYGLRKHWLRTRFVCACEVEGHTPASPVRRTACGHSVGDVRVHHPRGVSRECKAGRMLSYRSFDRESRPGGSMTPSHHASISVRQSLSLPAWLPACLPAACLALLAAACSCCLAAASLPGPAGCRLQQLLPGCCKPAWHSVSAPPCVAASLQQRGHGGPLWRAPRRALAPPYLCGDM